MITRTNDAVILLSVVLVRDAHQRAGSLPRAGTPASCR